MLLQERTLSNWERRRLQLIPTDVVVSGVTKSRQGEPLTLGTLTSNVNFQVLP